MNPNQLERELTEARLRERENVNLLIGTLLELDPDTRVPERLDPPCDAQLWNDDWPDNPIVDATVPDWLDRMDERIQRLVDQRNACGAHLAQIEKDRAQTFPIFYAASKPWHAPMWRMWRDKHHKRIAARWIDSPGENAFEAGRFNDLAETCLGDVRRCDAVVLYEDPTEHDAVLWTGALIEVGAALSMGKQVLAVVSPQTETRLDVWARHPNFQFVDSLEAAFGWRMAAK